MVYCNPLVCWGSVGGNTTSSLSSENSGCIQASFYPSKTTGQSQRPSSSSQTSQRSYCIPCKTCSKVYVGQNSRLLETRLSNHKAAVKHVKIDVSAVAEHVWKLGHQVDFKSTPILHENNQFRRCALESWHIRRHPSTCISQFALNCFFLLLSFIFS